MADSKAAFSSAKTVCERYDISDMTLWRWLQDNALRFPRPVVIRRRRFFNDQELDDFDRKRAAERDGVAA